MRITINFKFPAISSILQLLFVWLVFNYKLLRHKLSFTFYLSFDFLLITLHSRYRFVSINCRQCDQIARLLVQYLADYSNKNLHNSILFCQSTLKSFANNTLNNPLKFTKDVQNFARVAKLRSTLSHWLQIS